MRRTATYVLAAVFAGSFALAGGASMGLRQTARGIREDVGDALEQARVAAAADRHRQAIDLYLRAVGQDSLLLSTVSLELGHQYTWAEVPDSAIAWYEIYLGHHPGDIDARLGIARAMSWADRLHEAETCYRTLLPESGDRRGEVLVGLAKVLAWQERHGEAERLYREVLDEEPGNADARLGLAEAVNWSGRHRVAETMFTAVLESDPSNAEAIKGLAEAQLWLGRSDRAAETLDAASARGVQDDDLESVASAVRQTSRPHASASFSYRENSDDGEIWTTGVSLALPLGYLAEVSLAYTNGRLHKSGYPGIDRNQFAISMRRRFSDALVVTATPGYQVNRFDPISISPGPKEIDEFVLFVWDAYVTVTPGDWVRVDAGTSREAMDIPLPVFKRIHVTTENVGVDWRMVHRLTTFWGAKYSAYSDGNWRVAVSERAEWDPRVRIPYHRRNRFVVVQGVEYASFDKQLDNGYFCPRSYFYAFGGLRFVTDLGGNVSLGLDGRLGGEREAGNDWASVGSFEGVLRFRVSERVGLAAGYFKSGSRLDSPDGFRAEGLFVAVGLEEVP